MLYRKATEKDLLAIVALYADDILGKERESYQNPLPEVYIRAFVIIDDDENQELIVLEDTNGDIIGTLQLTYIQYLNRSGALRAQIESMILRKNNYGKD